VPVAGLGEEGGGLLVGGDGAVEPPHLQQGVAEVVKRGAFAVPVAGLGEEGGGLLVGGDGLVEPPNVQQGTLLIEGDRTA
jgi:hypothetical protein